MTYGDLVTMIEVAAFMTTMNFFACAETSAAASAFGGEQESGQDVDALAHDEFLRESFGDVGRRAADVAADDLDLFAGNRVAVLLHISLHAIVELDAGIGELAGEDIDHPDLDRALRVRGRDADGERDGAAKAQT